MPTIMGEAAKERRIQERVEEAYSNARSRGIEVGKLVSTLIKERTVEWPQADPFKDYMEYAFRCGLDEGLRDGLFEKRPETPVERPKVDDSQLNITTVISNPPPIFTPQIDTEPMVEVVDSSIPTIQQSGAPAAPSTPPSPPPVPKQEPPVATPEEIANYKPREGRTKTKKGKTKKVIFDYDLSTIPGNTQIPCACGCGEMFWRFNKKGYARRYIQGHQPSPPPPIRKKNLKLLEKSSVDAGAVKSS